MILRGGGGVSKWILGTRFLCTKRGILRKSHISNIHRGAVMRRAGGARGGLIGVRCLGRWCQGGPSDMKGVISDTQVIAGGTQRNAGKSLVIFSNRVFFLDMF